MAEGRGEIEEFIHDSIYPRWLLVLVLKALLLTQSVI